MTARHHPWLLHAIATKRDGGRIDAPTWTRIVRGYTAGEIDEAPVAALLMATAIRGLGEDETYDLTAAMVASGEVVAHRGTVVDKHSSGGVADTVSLIAVPLVAAAGVRVAKLSGRALGHTGGTLDKLEAIPGVRTDLAIDAFRAQVERIGCAIAAQSHSLVPADRLLYDLRDRTATVPSVGLIAASIVSKKIAGGASGIVFDVKVGRGSFVRTQTDAEDLAWRLVALAERFGRSATALVTQMDEPLGTAIGTGLEAIEARDFLRGVRRDARLGEVVALVAAEMLAVGGAPAAGAATALADGSAYDRFVALIEAQGGTRAGLEAMLPHPVTATVAAPAAGWLAAVDAVALGDAARLAVERSGPCAGIEVRVRIGDRVAAGQPLAVVRGGDGVGLAAAFALATEPVAAPPLVLAQVREALAGSSSKRTLS